ncbi:CBS domain-containing protein [Marinicauda salina]|nr:CBS domain-containing protein [Marinicauda salina]
MAVKDHMTPADEVSMVRRDTTLQDAARLMRRVDAGALPVNDGDKLIGMITDRDIAVRGVAEGKTGEATVGDVMTDTVLYAYEDAESAEVIANMEETGVRRMPVVDKAKRLKGVVTLADLSAGHAATAGEALAHIREQPAQH